MFLADRYIQIWINKVYISHENKTPLGRAFHSHESQLGPVATTAQLDNKLVRLKLVIRYEKNGEWFVKPRRGLFFLYTFFVYLICKCVLIVIFGDPKKHDYN